ncbi:transgelin [Elysia marginata]|uniref:Transgelin n=1 Tax=Elysia marginata TaxID=1093978 RepID=A0AAV4GNJ3_9GAST|nr:transgelin [Elysia marginata]
MANRGPSYGLSLECKQKIEKKFDIQRARDVLGWMEAVLGRKLHPDVASIDSQQDLAKVLKDGIVLCDLLNVISPGAVRPAKKSKLAFHQMENIELFTKACVAYGMHPLDVFQVPDLFETKAMFSVINCLHALGSLAKKKGFQGPSFGVKLSDVNKRKFSEQQITDGKKVIPMQAGTNLNPSQSGMTPYGQGRQIVPSDPLTAEPTTPSHTVISLQYGTNRLASQSGMTPYGLGRQILLSSGSGSVRSASIDEAEADPKRSQSESGGTELIGNEGLEDKDTQEMTHQPNGVCSDDVFDVSGGLLLT